VSWRKDRIDRARKTVTGLRKLYPDATCELTFDGPLQLAVAVILSAQCTDKRVNLVTPKLFKKYKTAEDFAESKPAELEAIIRSTGFYRSKAKSIREMAKSVVADFGGKLPRTMAELLTLRGVARKTANVILSSGFNLSEGIVVDTHMKRLAYRLGLTTKTDPVKVERDLMDCVAPKDWIYFSQGMVWHGRRACYARNPECSSCGLRGFCPRKKVTTSR
jgi:endonuclease-3